MQGSDNEERAVGNVPGNQIPALVAAAHELKSPLALVRQLSLALQTGGYSPKQIDALAERITLTSERALRLTNDLTRAARLEDSFFSLEPLNPHTMLEEVADELAPLYRAKGRAIIVSPRRYGLLAVANRDLLRRVLMNFADNALHYGDARQPVTLGVCARRKEGTIRLGVRDYGPAVPADIWRRGVQLSTEHALPMRPESSGLGVSIARQFAEHMGGHVGVTRHRDGATFYVDIAASMQMRLL